MSHHRWVPGVLAVALGAALAAPAHGVEPTEPTAPAGQAVDGSGYEAQLDELRLVVPEDVVAGPPDASPSTTAQDDAASAPDDVAVAPVDPGSEPEDVGTVPEDVGTVPEDVGTVQVDDGDVVVDHVEEAGRALSPVVESDGFQTVGVTWPEDASGPGTVEVRTRAHDGTWSAWTELPVADDAADEGTPDAEQAGLRAGTDPLWVGEADAVQVAVAVDVAVADLSLSLVSSPEGSATVAPTGVRGASVGAPVAAANGAPRVVSRAQWGAAPLTCAPDVASKLVGAVVHHTAGSNAYATQAQAMQQLRNDQRYHQGSRGWCDLGYNFVVDKWGTIYEGRANSLDEAVIGVHAGGFNTGTIGVAMLGTYDAAPSAATQRAVATIIGWRLGAYGVNPAATMDYYTGEGANSRYKNRWVTLPRVFGHRDVSFTACPGNGGHAALPAVRTMAATATSDERYRQSRAVVTSMYHHLLGRAPERAGLDDWSGQLANGAPAADVAASITRSEEYERRMIAKAYRSVLGRTTDEPGVLSWLAAIRAGTVKIDEIANHLVASNEFYLRNGGTDAGLVRGMYRDLLGRDGSAEEIRYWTSRVPTVGRGGVITSVTGSREAAQRKVQQNYRLFLDRYPDIPGQSLLTDVLLVHGEAAVRANILGSTEYRLRAVARYA